MSQIDPLAYAQKLIRSTESRKDKNTTFSVPVERLRLLCSSYIDLAEQEPAEQNTQPVALTDREREAFEIIKSMINNLERPTVRSVATAMKYKTPNSAGVIINRLEKYGLINKVGNRKQIVLA